jgi:hypothetical protein
MNFKSKWFGGLKPLKNSKSQCHCEEDGDEAISNSSILREARLLHFVRNDRPEPFFGGFSLLKMKEDGVALIAVIFLLIVIGALGIAMSNVMQNQASQVGLTLTINCADYAAVGGARFGSEQIVDGGWTGGNYPVSPAAPQGPYTMPNPALLASSGCNQFVLSCKDNFCSTVIGAMP